MLGLSVRPARFVTRASAGSRASSAASVSEVWDVLAHADRWAEFDPFVRSVRPDPDGGTVAELEAGQRFCAQLRLWQVEVPIEVDHVVNRCSVVVTARLMPGLAEEVEHVVIPSSTGGSLLTIRLTLHGPLALPALIPRWLVRTITVRLLARTAEAGLLRPGRAVSSVA